MSTDQRAVESSVFLAHEPALETMADALMANMASFSPLELSEIMGISHQLAVKASSLAYDFAHKLTGVNAIFAFIGEAFRALDISSIPEDKLTQSQDNLRIISSVYGILSPFDIIKPYRCEFNKKIAPDGKTPIQYFKPKVTIELVNEIKGKRVMDIINLLPGDADKCVDWKIIRSFVPVHKICFQTIGNSGELKTPLAKRLKELRGLMCRQIIEEGINSFKQLTEMESQHFIFSPKDSKPGLAVFIS